MTAFWQLLEQLARAGSTSHLHPAPADRSKWPAHLKHLKSIKSPIPPAWKHVHISHDPHADLQATGIDKKGRQQYAYHIKHHATQAHAKFNRVERLRKHWHEIDKKVKGHAHSSDPKIRDHAHSMSLVMHMGLRPGGEGDTKAEKQAHGATTLKGSHVVHKNGKTHLHFVGKKGVMNHLEVPKHLEKMVKERAKKAGPKGKLFPHTTANSLLNYSKSLHPAKYRTKDFRTHVGTTLAAKKVAETKTKPSNPKEYKKAVKEVATHVANHLGNTPTVAAQSYISPHVFAHWRAHSGA